jgi:calcineurin-like phosphoesterase family protein
LRNIFAASDHHFGHANILKFTDSDGDLIRGARFSCIEEHDETIIENHNKIVKDEDIVYFMGDVTFRPRELGRILPRMKGRKRLLLGNHDPEVLELHKHFQKIMLWRIFKDEKIVLSHFPLREDQFRWKVDINGHGHTHQNLVPGPYANLCMEHTNYSPVALEDIPAIAAQQAIA